MMYWIVFALFTSVETFSDFFLSFWFPFYYELKICLLIWLLSPATKGQGVRYGNRKSSFKKSKYGTNLITMGFKLGQLL